MPALPSAARRCRCAPAPHHFPRSRPQTQASSTATSAGYILAVPFDRDQMKQTVTNLATKGVFIGTSSWKYEGWFGQLYTPARYEYRGKVAKTRFERDCLGEYSEVFKTVCVDAAYYTFPSDKYLAGLVEKVPSDFQFGFKVTDEITELEIGWNFLN